MRSIPRSSLGTAQQKHAVSEYAHASARLRRVSYGNRKHGTRKLSRWRNLDQVDRYGAAAAATAGVSLPRACITACVGRDDDAGRQAGQDIAEAAEERVEGGVEQRESHIWIRCTMQREPAGPQG